MKRKVYTETIDEAPAAHWPKTTMRRRLNDCASMLFINGLLTDAERARVAKRIDTLARRMRRQKEGTKE